MIFLLHVQMINMNEACTKLFRAFEAVIYRVQVKGADKFWARVPHTKIRKKVHINLYPEHLNCELIAERVYL
jgi:hypothetical protein